MLGCVCVCVRERESCVGGSLGTHHHERQVALGDSAVFERGAQGGEAVARLGRHKYAACGHVEAVAVHGRELRILHQSRLSQAALDGALHLLYT